jgi:hypothetical protein
VLRPSGYIMRHTCGSSPHLHFCCFWFYSSHPLICIRSLLLFDYASCTLNSSLGKNDSESGQVRYKSISCHYRARDVYNRHSVTGENISVSTTTKDLQGMFDYLIIRHTSKCTNRKQQTHAYFHSNFYNQFHSTINGWAIPEEDKKNWFVHGNQEI